MSPQRVRQGGYLVLMGRKIAAIFYNTDEGRKRRKIRKKYSAEEKIRIVLIGLRGEDSIAGLCHT
jgi:hypothetical protein